MSTVNNNLTNNIINDESSFIILSRENKHLISNEIKRKCKILKFTPEWKLYEIVAEISKLDPNYYQNLYIFIIGSENFEFSIENGLQKKVRLGFEYLADSFTKFNWTRKIVLQITSTNVKKPKLYIKNENSKEFIEFLDVSITDVIDNEAQNILIKMENNIQNGTKFIKEISKKIFAILHKPRNLIQINNLYKIECENGRLFNDNPNNLNSLNEQQISIKVEPKWEYDPDDLNQNTEILPISSIKEEDVIELLDIKSEDQNNYQQISEDEFDDHVKNRKFVVISGRNKSGRTWFLKNFKNKLKEKLPSHWIEYVDLQQFPYDKNTQNTDLKFTTFMTKKVLRNESNQSSEDFMSLYNKGKVCILFDGFDAIDPNYAKSVTKIFQLLQHNGGNRAWIATRNDFNVNLKEELNIDAAYKLDEFVPKPRADVITLLHNFLQSELMQNKSLEYHEQLWKIITKCLESQQSVDQSTNQLTVNMIKHVGNDGKNLLHTAVEFNTLEVIKFTILKIKENFRKVDGSGLDEFFSMADKSGKNILHVVIETDNEEKLKLIWSELESYFKTENMHDKFKKMFFHKIIKKKSNLLELAIRYNNIQYHNVLWDHLTNTFENREELKELILQKNSYEYNFVHLTTIYSSPTIFLFTFYKLNQLFNIEEILMTKAFHQRNLIQTAIIHSKNIQKHELILKIIQKLCETNGRFFEIFKETDIDNNNVFLTASSFTSFEIFQILLRRAQSLATFDEIKLALTAFGSSNANILQCAARNKSYELFEFVFTTISQYFSLQEILAMIEYKDANGCNLLQIVAKKSSIDIATFTWEKIKSFIGIGKLESYLNQTNYKGENFLHLLLKSNDPKKLKFFINELKYLFTNCKFLEEILITKNNQNNKNILHYVALSSDQQFHEIFWEFLLEMYNDQYKKSELMDMMLEKDGRTCFFITYLIYLEYFDAAEFIFSLMFKIFTAEQFREIFVIKLKYVQFGQNILQLLTTKPNYFKTFKLLWNLIRNSYQSFGTFMEFLKHSDALSDNILHLTAKFGSKELLEFIIMDLKKYIDVNDIKKFLCILCRSGKNILQSATKHNNSLEFHQYLWKIIHKYFNSNEILGIIMHSDHFGSNAFHLAAEFNTKEILEFTWNEMKQYFIEPDESSAQDQETIENFMLKKDNNGNNFIHRTIYSNNPDKIDFVLQKLQRELSFADHQKILTSKGFKDRNLLQTVVCKSQDIKVHEILVKKIHFSKSDINLKNIIKEVDMNDDNLIHLAASYSSSEIFDFWINQLEKITSLKKIRKILNMLGSQNKNLLQLAAQNNKFIETHQALWKIIRKYFNSSEILNMIQHTSSYDADLFQIVVRYNSKEIIELTLTEIQNSTTEIKQEGNVLRKYFGNY